MVLGTVRRDLRASVAQKVDDYPSVADHVDAI